MMRAVTRRNFAAVNIPLSALRADERNLVVSVCVSGRHRSVANTHAIERPICRKLYAGNKTKMGFLHLGEEGGWGKLCRRECPSCDGTSAKYMAALDIADEKLQGTWIEVPTASSC